MGGRDGGVKKETLQVHVHLFSILDDVENLLSRKS